jgi:hypothetical protein
MEHVHFVLRVIVEKKTRKSDSKTVKGPRKRITRIVRNFVKEINVKTYSTTVREKF